MRYEIGEIVKVIFVGAMFSDDYQIAQKLGATCWSKRKPFDQTLEGQYAVIKNYTNQDEPRYLIEFYDGEQYIIGGSGISQERFILSDDLFEI